MEGIKHQKLPLALWNLDRIDKQGSALNSTYRRVSYPPRITRRSFYAHTSLSQRHSYREAILLEVKPEEAILLVSVVQSAQLVLAAHGPKAGTRQGLESRTPHDAQSLTPAIFQSETFRHGLLDSCMRCYTALAQKGRLTAIPST